MSPRMKKELIRLGAAIRLRELDAEAARIRRFLAGSRRRARRRRERA